MSKALVKQLLTSSNYWTLNKTVVRMFGIETAFLLTNLAEAETMMADKDGWFFQTSETLEEITTLSRYKQDKSIEQLEKAGILHKEVRGIPAKRYFKLDYEALANKIVKKSQTGLKETDKLVGEKMTTNKELIYKELSNKESKDTMSSSDEHDGASAIPHKDIVDYLNQQTGSKYRHTTKKTRDLIKARHNEGFTLEDFKQVIDIKTAEWQGTDMSKFLRPETLFGTKFEGYLNQQPQQQQITEESLSWE